MLEQKITVVMDPIRTTGKRYWNLESLFNQQMKKICPFAEKSEVVVNVDSNDGFKLIGVKETTTPFDITDEDMPLSIGIIWDSNQQIYGTF